MAATVQLSVERSVAERGTGVQPLAVTTFACPLCANWAFEFGPHAGTGWNVHCTRCGSWWNAVPGVALAPPAPPN